MIQLKLIRKIYSLEWESSKEDLEGLFKEFNILKRKHGEKYTYLEDFLAEFRKFESEICDKDK